MGITNYIFSWIYALFHVTESITHTAKVTKILGLDSHMTGEKKTTTIFKEYVVEGTIIQVLLYPYISEFFHTYQ